MMMMMMMVDYCLSKRTPLPNMCGPLGPLVWTDVVLAGLTGASGLMSIISYNGKISLFDLSCKVSSSLNSTHAHKFAILERDYIYRSPLRHCCIIGLHNQ